MEWIIGIAIILVLGILVYLGWRMEEGDRKEAERVPDPTHLLYTDVPRCPHCGQRVDHIRYLYGEDFLAWACTNCRREVDSYRRAEASLDSEADRLWHATPRTFEAGDFPI